MTIKNLEWFEIASKLNVALLNTIENKIMLF